MLEWTSQECQSESNFRLSGEFYFTLETVINIFEKHAENQQETYFHLQIQLSCNVRTEVVSVSEPSRCEYFMEFNTPAVCHYEETEEPPYYHEEL